MSAWGSPCCVCVCASVLAHITVTVTLSRSDSGFLGVSSVLLIRGAVASEQTQHTPSSLHIITRCSYPGMFIVIQSALTAQYRHTAQTRVSIQQKTEKTNPILLLCLIKRVNRWNMHSICQLTCIIPQWSTTECSIYSGVIICVLLEKCITMCLILQCV